MTARAAPIKIRLGLMPRTGRDDEWSLQILFSSGYLLFVPTFCAVHLQFSGNFQELRTEPGIPARINCP